LVYALVLLRSGHVSAADRALARQVLRMSRQAPASISGISGRGDT
jgi:hypothetical protein